MSRKNNNKINEKRRKIYDKPTPTHQPTHKRKQTNNSNNNKKQQQQLTNIKSFVKVFTLT